MDDEDGGDFRVEGVVRRSLFFVFVESGADVTACDSVVPTAAAAADLPSPEQERGSPSTTELRTRAAAGDAATAPAALQASRTLSRTTSTSERTPAFQAARIVSQAASTRSASSDPERTPSTLQSTSPGSARIAASDSSIMLRSPPVGWWMQVAACMVEVVDVSGHDQKSHADGRSTRGASCVSMKMDLATPNFSELNIMALNSLMVVLDLIGTGTYESRCTVFLERTNNPMGPSCAWSPRSRMDLKSIPETVDNGDG